MGFEHRTTVGLDRSLGTLYIDDVFYETKHKGIREVLSKQYHLKEKGGLWTFN